MRPSQRRALDAYVALERRAQEAASGHCAHVCAACRGPCCGAAFCRESWEAPWLAAAIAREGARRGVAPGARAVEGHLATDGCRLAWGRPPVCYEFSCGDVLGTLRTHDEKYLYRALSHVVTFAGQDALPGTHLVEVTDLARLDAARTRRLLRRIALAGRLLDAAARLFRARGRGAAADWAVVRRHFADRGYRLSFGADASAEEAAAARARRGPAAARPLPLVRS